jgi:three-Cys-motif partner protein
LSKRNDDFFREKKSWSEVKDELLGCYLKPYVSKILHTSKPLVYVDSFAGKGKFEDGNNGSPLIALGIIEECIHASSKRNTNVNTFFIDLNYADELKNNLKDYPNANIISGKYEDNIETILKNKIQCNIFLYIDPYGIKALNCDLFRKFAQSNFYSIELLINLNSFGFIREGCHALGIEYQVDADIFEDLVEYDPTQMGTSEKSINQLNEIAGGDYWIDIIEGYKAKHYDGYQAEKMFAEQYCTQLMKLYKYVLNMPLRIKRGQRPKYRMVHATNHDEGCLIMADNIYNRWQVFQEKQALGQLSLFPQDIENKLIPDDTIKNNLIEHLQKYKNFTPINIILSEYFIKYSIGCSTSVLRKLLEEFEVKKQIEIIREPAQTEHGKPTVFFTSNNKHKIFIRSCGV